MSRLNTSSRPSRFLNEVESASPSVDVDFVLRSTDIKAGEKVFTIINNGTGNAGILVKSSNGDLLGIVWPGSSGQVMALVDAPTAYAHWRLLGPWTEFAFSTATNVAAGSSDTTSFGYGPGGFAFGAIDSVTASSQVLRRIRFRTPPRANDMFLLEFDVSTGTQFVPVGFSAYVVTYQSQNTGNYGIGMYNQSSTDWNIGFGGYGYKPGGATFGAVGSAWSGISTWKWRIRKQTN